MDRDFKEAFDEVGDVVHITEINFNDDTDTNNVPTTNGPILGYIENKNCIKTILETRPKELIQSRCYCLDIKLEFYYSLA